MLSTTDRHCGYYTTLPPHLRTYKPQRAQLILEHYIRLTPRNGKYTKELKAERGQFEQAVLAIKAAC